MPTKFTTSYVEDALAMFHQYKTLAERAMAQAADDHLFAAIDEENNSIAIIVKHMAGNMRSRWTDFLTTDGEKPDRHRDTEFELIEDTRESLMRFWEDGWKILFDSLEPLTDEDFSKMITIRGEPHTVVEAINRQLTHYSYHIGQIVFLAKHLRSKEWKNLSVPKNRSADFNKYVKEKVESDPSAPKGLQSGMEFAKRR